MQVTSYKLVMFDLDGTLVDSVFDLHVALNRTLHEMDEPEVTIQEARIWVGNGAAMLVNRALHRALHVAEEHPKLARALECFYRHYTEVNGAESECYEGARELIAELRALGSKVAIVTNKPFEPARVLIEKLNLDVDLVIGGDSTPERKPSPKPIEACLEFFQIVARDAVMVGDSSNDFLAAEAAGVACVGVSYGYNHGVEVQPEQVGRLVDSLNELRYSS